MLHVLFETMVGVPLFYRDLQELTSRIRTRRQRFAETTRRGESTIAALCRGMVEAGTIQPTTGDRGHRAEVAIVSTYWISFQLTSSRPPRVAQAGYE